jgi:hypothetical protein
MEEHKQHKQSGVHSDQSNQVKQLGAGLTIPDDAGRAAFVRWSAQLMQQGAGMADGVDVSALRLPDGRTCNDLADAFRLCGPDAETEINLGIFEGFTP